MHRGAVLEDHGVVIELDFEEAIGVVSEEVVEVALEEQEVIEVVIKNVTNEVTDLAEEVKDEAITKMTDNTFHKLADKTTDISDTFSRSCTNKVSQEKQKGNTFVTFFFHIY